jgi:hypothetical protein
MTAIARMGDMLIRPPIGCNVMATEPLQEQLGAPDMSLTAPATVEAHQVPRRLSFPPWYGDEPQITDELAALLPAGHDTRAEEAADWPEAMAGEDAA